MEELIEKIHKILDEHWEQLKTYPNVLNVSVSKKFVKGENTGVDCITVYVAKKKKRIAAQNRIPVEINGIPTDVIELSSPDFELGETAASRKSPAVQRMIAGGVKKE
jgi:hypothetical protein